MEQLVQKGADVSAYRHDNPVAHQVLLRHGADPNRTALKIGQFIPPTPLEKARQCENQELCNLLLGIGL